MYNIGPLDTNPYPNPNPSNNSNPNPNPNPNLNPNPNPNPPRRPPYLTLSHNDKITLFS